MNKSCARERSDQAEDVQTTQCLFPTQAEVQRLHLLFPRIPEWLALYAHVMIILIKYPYKQWIWSGLKNFTLDVRIHLSF